MPAARRVFASAALLLVAACAQPVSSPTEQQIKVDQARITFDKLITHPDFGELPDFMRRSKAVLIFPSLIKGGVVVGGESGTGVLVVRDAGRGWSDPAFYSVYAGSLGLQIGDHAGEQVVGHAGIDIGYNSFLSMLPAQSAAVIVMTNFNDLEEFVMPAFIMRDPILDLVVDAFAQE